MLRRAFVLVVAAGTALAGACTDVSPDTGGANADASPGHLADAHVQVGCSPSSPCYTVYAHSDFVLYHVDLANQSLVEIGPFDTPDNDVITDLAVSPDDGLWGVSEASYLYRVSSTTGAATRVTSLASCGSFTVALSFAVDGSLYAGDFNGAFCSIDLDQTPPAVAQVGTLGGGLALAGDLVAVADGTLYGTAIAIGGGGSNNLLVQINPSTGAATTIGATSYPNLYGIAYEEGRVFGFTHDGSGRVVTLDPDDGSAQLYGTFNAPGTSTPISFAGAAVNPNVPPVVE